MVTPSIEGHVPARGAAALTGLGTLMRLVLRRERLGLILWVIGIAVFTVALVAAMPGLYQDAGDRAARAQLMLSPGARAMTGPGYGLENYYTFGAMVNNEFLPWIAFFAASMSIGIMVRNTRGEEESGRAEMIRANPVGRHVPMVAALLVATAANLVLGGLLALGMGALGVESIGWGSSVLFGAAVASIGVAFTAIAAVAAQAAATARGASGLAFMAFGTAFIVRAAGDMASLGGSALSWLSPIGWAQQTRMFVDDRWWPLGLALLLAAALVAATFWLGTRRDLGAGLISARPGRSRAARSLTTPLGLAWRLQRGGLLWWGLVMFVFTFVYGSLVGQVETFASEMSIMQDLLADLSGSLIESFLGVVMSIWAVVGAVYALTAVLRVRSEERGGLAEPVLATAVSRSNYLLAHVIVAVGGAGVVMLVTGLGMGLGAGQSVGDWSMLPKLLGAALAYVPGIALTASVGVALFGLLPAATPLAWAVLVYAGIVGWFGVVLRFPDWMMKLSTLGHTPMLPAEPMSWGPLLALSGLAVVLIAVGVVGFRRRDLESPT